MFAITVSALGFWALVMKKMGIQFFNMINKSFCKSNYLFLRATLNVSQMHGQVVA